MGQSWGNSLIPAHSPTPSTNSEEDVQFVCVLILKVPSYFKILKNKTVGTSPGGFQG